MSNANSKPREIVIISGKGGTGKTSLTAAFAHLAQNKILCDLDVDAPDLHILLSPEPRHTEQFISGHEAVIRSDDCTACGQCLEVCRFGAVVQSDAGYAIDPLRCEGCKVCVTLCPEQAIDFPDRHCGTWYISDTRFGTMVHAQLFAGEENSGRLVTLLKQQARELAAEAAASCILCDGAPGIGCPVISSLSGASLAVIITEPTPSGLHDLERVAELCGHFRIPTAVIINKYDLNESKADEIAALCETKGWTLVARLPHDGAVTRAMVQRQTITEANDSGLGAQIREAWTKIARLAGIPQTGSLETNYTLTTK